jgi:hypothetical protein
LLGLAALGVLWTNTLLIAWSAARRLFALRSDHPAFVRDVCVLEGGIVAILGGAGVCTALALYPPVFGAVSTGGGLACLLFFLLVQPFGTALRDTVTHRDANVT